MSDLAPQGDAPVAEPVVAPEAAPAAAPEADPFENAATETFPRSYVEKLRNEAAEYRTKYAPFRDAFGEVDEDLRDYVLNDIISPLLSDSPAAALDELYGVVERIHNANKTVPKWLEKQIAAVEDEIDPDAPLTLKQWESIQAKKAEEEATQTGLREIMTATTALGYPANPKDDKFGDLASLFAISTNHTKGDLQKAHEIRQARFNEAVEQALEERLQAIKTGAVKWPAVSTSGSSPAEAKDEPKTFAEARKRANARMDKWMD